MRKYLILFILLLSSNVFAQTNNESLGQGGVIWCDAADPNNTAGITGYNCPNATAAGGSIATGDRNVFIGDNAGITVSTGSYNTFVGESAGLNQTNASENTFIGHQAGFSNTTGTDNTFIGNRAGFSNTATDNTFIGTDSGYSNTTGVDNTFIGEQAGLDNTTGSNNVFIGEDAGYNNTDGDSNVAVGDNSLRNNRQGHYNTAIGHEAGYDIGKNSDTVFASRNTLVGNGAGGDIGSGVGNTMLGANTGANTEHANFNTFVGVFSGWDNNRSNSVTNANRNTGLGVFAGYNNRDGEDNVWVGAFANSGNWGSSSGLIDDMHITCDLFCEPYSSGGGNTTIYRTTVLGASSAVLENDGVAIGYRARTRGDSAIVIGSQANSYTPAADYSIAIGASATTTHQESIVLGYQTASHAANTFTVGNSNTISWDPSTDSVTSLGVSQNCYEDINNPPAIICDPMYRFSDVATNKISVQATTANSAEIDLFADDGSANDDKWSLSVANGGDFSIQSFVSGANVNKLTIANTGNVVIAGDLALNSDRRLKRDIKAIDNSLAIINQLQGKSFQWKDEHRKQGKHLGFIAQEIEEVLPSLVSEDKEGIKSVNYQGITPIIVNAIKELNDKNQKQDQLILQLQNLIEQQQALIIKLSK